MRPLGVLLLVAVPLLAAAGCSYVTVDDGELARAIEEARVDLDAGEPRAAIDALRGVARRRGDSVEAREMLVDACLAVDTIESRRYAEEILRELVDLEPGEPRHRYELAVLLMQRGFDRYAFDELESLRALDPDHAGAYLALADYHRSQWQRYNEDEHLQAMVAATERAVELDPSNIEAQRRWVRSLMLIGRFAEARARLDTLIESDAATPWLRALRGACRFGVGEYELARQDYERALDGMSPVERAPFIDFTLLADPYTVARLSDMPPDEARGFRHVFWKAQDPTPTTPINERLLEHYRRVTMADVLYENPRLGLRGFETARGQMYIRYGEPLARRFVHGYVTNRLVPPRWVHAYDVDGEVMTVTFADYALNGRFYLLIDQFPTAADFAAYTAPQRYAHHYHGRWLDHRMAMAAFRPRAAGAPRRPDEARRGHGLSPALTRQELYIEVPVDSLAAYGGEALQVDAVVFDEDWVEELRRSEVVRLDAAPRAGATAPRLVHQLALPLPPGDYRVATRVSGIGPAADSALAVESNRVETLSVEPFTAHGLELSDLELAYRIGAPRRGPFDKGEVEVIPNASRTYGAGELLYVYFEIYGLERIDGRARYRLDYRIRPASLASRTFFARIANAFRNKSFVRASVDEEAVDTQVGRYLAIDVEALPPDRYHLTLNVTDTANGNVVSRQVEFEKRAPETGADDDVPR
ncbi:MAG: GWxTD domain-containing protein [Candidatus Eiseniibacteriota bacterium]|jgi:GWxTD domain-containing protein